MRRRRPPVETSPRPSDSPYVEDWVEPTEPVPVMPATVTREQRELLPGEPPEALRWRLLAQERAESAWKAWGRSQPRVPLGDPRDVEVVATRAGLARKPQPQPVVPERLVVPLFQGGVRCRWREVHAFLSRVP
jgi:hypothetical protein